MTEDETSGVGKQNKGLDLQKLRASIDKLGLRIPDRPHVPDEDIAVLRHNNTFDAASRYHASPPDPSSELHGNISIITVEVDKLRLIVDSGELISAKARQALSDVASRKAYLPFVGWREEDSEPHVINGRHRIEALAELRFALADIVCPHESVDILKRWFSDH